MLCISRILQNKHDLISEASKSLNSLNVFSAEKGLLRVGGRLQNSKLTYSTKHPTLLPKDDKVINTNSFS